MLSGQSIALVDIPYFNDAYFSGTIQLNQSNKLENFVETWAGLNKKRMGFYGYRVKIFSQVGIHARKNANSTRLSCEAAYPNVPVYVVYNEPDFEVHIGDFRTKFEAMALLQKLKDKYQGAFVVYEIINFPEL
jgi:hypothetical protein